MKKTILFLALIIFSSSVSAQEVKEAHIKEYDHLILANVSAKFPYEVEVGGGVLVHLKFPFPKNPNWALSIAGSHEMAEDTSTALLFGVCRKFSLKDDAVILETGLLVGPEIMSGPRTHFRFGFVTALASKNIDCFGTAEYGLISGFHYKVYALWFPVKFFGVGFESQLHTITGVKLALKPIPNFWISFANGGYVFEGNLQYSIGIEAGYKFNIHSD